MKFYLIGSTSFAWPELLKELPSEHVTALDSKRINVQSINSFVRLMRVFDCSTFNVLDSSLEDTPHYILDLWQLTFWFELPFDIVEELISKSRIRTLNVIQPRNDYNKGLLTGTLKDWKEVCQLRGKPFVSEKLSKLILFVIGFFERESLTSLLED